MTWNWSNLDLHDPSHRFLALCYIANLLVWVFRLMQLIIPRPKQLLRHKYTQTGGGTVVLGIHITGGVMEILLGLVAFFLNTDGHLIPLYGTVAACALGLHFPTALIMTPSVYGARRLMRPFYVAASALHAYCAIRLIIDPLNREWLIATLIVLHTYIWVRVFYFLLWRTHTFRGATYTLSVVLAVFFTFGYIPGAGDINLGVIVFAWIFLYCAVEYFILKYVFHTKGVILESNEIALTLYPTLERDDDDKEGQ
ncbi:hypothetical protein M427DRAFT_159372 [Gonapodya prolifera JEL478]|uniref:Uncharacterized protein n=1 Tax=Gonapodya prolifera (strain JEL478) TaxID=1344416 RepID=A0A139A0S1_GONPJ|nr:hypothetical protein M427DRAFT_159372 [Gonapodya prolifera JEL478]|eukprot:KXS10376.1 hypothetical protein M427DRAFT_159372 [Gonapodya prolifera JEL478]